MYIWISFYGHSEAFQSDILKNKGSKRRFCQQQPIEEQFLVPQRTFQWIVLKITGLFHLCFPLALIHSISVSDTPHWVPKLHPQLLRVKRADEEAFHLWLWAVHNSDVHTGHEGSPEVRKERWKVTEMSIRDTGIQIPCYLLECFYFGWK